MQSPLRLLTIAFVLAFAGPSLWRAQAGEVPPIVQAVRRAGPPRGAKIAHAQSTTAQAQVGWSKKLVITHSAHDPS